MRTPTALRRIDDRLLGDRFRRRPATADRPPRTGKGLRETLAVVARVCRLVFLLLALTVALGIVFTLAPTNPDNVVVRNVLEIARDAAGPFRDVFTVADDAERETVVNYAFAAGVYLLASLLVPKLLGGSKA